MSKEKYDKRGNLIYKFWSNFFNGCSEWYEYDENNNLIHTKNSEGFNEWKEYDDNSNLIYHKNVHGLESWGKWKNDKYISITKQKFEQIRCEKQDKEFLSRKSTTRFELMDI